MALERFHVQTFKVFNLRFRNCTSVICVKVPDAHSSSIFLSLFMSLRYMRKLFNKSSNVSPRCLEKRNISYNVLMEEKYKAEANRKRQRKRRHHGQRSRNCAGASLWQQRCKQLLCSRSSLLRSWLCGECLSGKIKWRSVRLCAAGRDKGKARKLSTHTEGACFFVSHLCQLLSVLF